MQISVDVVSFQASQSGCQLNPWSPEKVNEAYFVQMMRVFPVSKHMHFTMIILLHVCHIAFLEFHKTKKTKFDEIRA